ncbi:MAG TPA: sugar ABC transporter permease, partial [Candidatus Wallbacteria bacterium]|nr:sugar ABC transporter permease [Candidatus Wallbacteria bacterium]
LIYLTALCNIPKDYFEAAAVDGAGPVKTFVKITFPLLLPQTMFLAISLTIDAMQVFAPVMLLTEGGPANSSEVVMHRVYKEAFNNLNMGAASAMSLILFAFILVASIIQYKYFKYDY